MLNADDVEFNRKRRFINSGFLVTCNLFEISSYFQIYKLQTAGDSNNSSKCHVPIDKLA